VPAGVESRPAAGSCNGKRNEGNLDPSHGQRSDVGDTLAGGPGDRVFLRCFVGGDGGEAPLLPIACGGTASCSSAVPVAVRQIQNRLPQAMSRQKR